MLIIVNRRTGIHSQKQSKYRSCNIGYEFNPFYGHRKEKSQSRWMDGFLKWNKDYLQWHQHSNSGMIIQKTVENQQSTVALEINCFILATG
ncbi:hypothetical protein [Belliella baltica]|uniref:hypothetical protein n=1 Tax=Belliella baltica TaxID=232259 RepID=UPI0005A26E6A|nr:hypothetical protein [Belliella baltica]